MSEAAASGQKALDAGRYSDSIAAYTTALSQAPTSPDFFIKRSMAYHKSKQYDAALRDTEAAITHAYKRGNKDLRTTAQFRRSLALLALNQPIDAKFCLDIAARDGCKDKALSVWMAKVDQAIEKMQSTDASGTSTLLEIPAEASGDGDAIGSTGSHTKIKTAPVPSMLPVAKKPNFEWYQNDSSVIITFYIPDVPQDKCTVDISSSSLSLDFPILSTGSEYRHDFDRLFANVDPDKSSYRVLKTKIEVVLEKAKRGRWAKLEGSDLPQDVKISYPTSSRTGPKNWEALSGQTEEEKPEGDAALTQLFQTLYKDADEDTRKAMIKSYTESGGTSLSTDWKSVKNGRVDVKPPEGMEARKFEQ